MAAALQQPLNEEEIKIPSGNCQGLSREVKFGGILWVSDSAVIPPDLEIVKKECTWVSYHFSSIVLIPMEMQAVEVEIRAQRDSQNSN